MLIRIIRNRRVYNSDFGDIVSVILAKALDIRIDTYKQLSGTIHLLRIGCDSSPLLAIHCVDDHYSGLKPNRQMSLCSAESSNTPEPVKLLTYSSSSLRHLGYNTEHKIKRSIRKTLFKHNLWKPKVKNTSCDKRRLAPSASNLLYVPLIKKTEVISMSNLTCCVLNARSAKHKSKNS